MPFVSLQSDEVARMLGSLGLNRLEDLFAHLPDHLKRDHFDLPDGRSQLDVEQALTRSAGAHQKAVDAPCFLGGGAYDHWCPPPVRELLKRGEFYTAYTPYQPEIAQGILQALFEYQTMLARLCGVAIANASLYDGATAVLEGILLAVRKTRREKILVDAGLNPRWREVVETGASGLGLSIVDVPCGSLESGRRLDAMADALSDEVACVVVPNPDFLGRMTDLSVLSDKVHQHGALMMAVVSPMSSILFQSGGEAGADMVCGEAQEFGLPLNFGGPYLGFLACSKPLVRLVPGRLVGLTQDVAGNRAFTLTLQTREQHIRREKATSNICTNQSLCAFAAGMYLAAMGGEGLKRAAGACLTGTARLREKVGQLKGVTVFPGTYWREFVFRTSKPASEVCRRMLEQGILAGAPLASMGGQERPQLFQNLAGYSAECTDGDILCAVTEKRTAGDIDHYVLALESVLADLEASP